MSSHEKLFKERSILRNKHKITSRPLVGVSKCLLGEKVRYDGDHKQIPFLTDELIKTVDFLPVCPEVDCGLSIPREPMQLVEINGRVKLQTVSSHIDHTDLIQAWIKDKITELEHYPLCGFITKARSPSCGMRTTNLFSPENIILRQISGLFINKLMQRFPKLPLEDESGIQDEKRQQVFLGKIMARNKKLRNQ